MDNVTLIKGFFHNTLIPENIDNIGEIAVLRLDGDWYESTMTCLKHLFPKVVKGGLIILDDYYRVLSCREFSFYCLLIL
jgi:hypothetical protein